MLRSGGLRVRAGRWLLRWLVRAVPASWRELAVLCRTANVRSVRVHDFRHTCATLLLAQGVDARTIMETLGRSTITMTLDTYAHVMETTLKAAAARMDDALGLASGGEEESGAEGAPESR
ncbi:tyrosine-type recombinase/integrase [Streptomyces marincola]|uniref:tyrosine-type recombinase/integrase n=1 Tax=Streptomyces marincola TaxID=2878388 RepID=UPI001CF3B577|nr:tyrosine-type recombinase/integrase [Streptomyces marincola]UCM92006.1 tyrosine-type recombinase/integrase [Streptomyces marincola]